MSSLKLQGHTQKKKLQILTRIDCFRTVSELKFEFTDGFEMMGKAWCSIEKVPYGFSSSSIKFPGHTGWKIDKFNPVWVKLLGRLQLSNPSDLPCWFIHIQILLICIHFQPSHGQSVLLINWVDMFFREICGSQYRTKFRKVDVLQLVLQE